MIPARFDVPLVRRLEVLETTTSTNEVARRLASEGAPDGTVVLATCQTGGRGRLGRTWYSASGLGLYLSILLRPDEPIDRIGRYSLVAAVATLESCREFGARDAHIKWPNDVVAAGRKIAGILAELRTGPKGAELVLGFGINVSHAEADFPAELAPRSTSLRMVTGAPVDDTRLAAALLKALDLWIGRLRAGSWEEVAAAFVRYAPGVEAATVRLASGENGVTRGLDTTGALRVETGNGIRLVHAGESIAMRED